MSCAPHELSSYLDERLDSRARTAVQLHLASCSGCTGELRLLARAGELLATEGQPQAPEGLASRLTRAALASAPAPEASFAERWLRVAWPAAATAAIVAALLILLAARSAGPDASTPPGPSNADPLAEIASETADPIDSASSLLAMEAE